MPAWFEAKARYEILLRSAKMTSPQHIVAHAKKFNAGNEPDTPHFQSMLE